MTINHEDILYIVEKKVNTGLTFFHPSSKRWVFRTRAAAYHFRDTRKSGTYIIRKATWGPDN